MVKQLNKKDIEQLIKNYKKTPPFQVGTVISYVFLTTIIVWLIYFLVLGLSKLVFLLN